MAKKKEPTSSAAEIMHRRYIKGNKRRLKYIEQEKQRVKIAQKIYELRNQANLTQQELAERIGSRQSVISRLENADYDRHSLRMLHKIAHAMHCKVEVRLVPENGNYAYA